MTLTVDDRELIEAVRDFIYDATKDEFSVGWTLSTHQTEDLLKLARQSLLSERDKLEQLLERVWACRVNVQGRFVNLEKLWPVIDDIGVVLSQREVP